MIKPGEESTAQPDTECSSRRAFLQAGAGVAGTLAASAGFGAQAQGTPRADRALWIGWYDVPDEAREHYLSWLHGKYIPALLERPGVLWAAHYASVDRGSVRTIRRDGAGRSTRFSTSSYRWRRATATTSRSKTAVPT